MVRATLFFMYIGKLKQEYTMKFSRPHTHYRQIKTLHTPIDREPCRVVHGQGQYPANSSEPCFLPPFFRCHLSLIHRNPWAVPSFTFLSPVAAAALVFPAAPCCLPPPSPAARGLGSSPLSHWSAHDVPNELLRCMMSVSRSAERAIERGAGWKSPEMRQRLSAPGTKQETGRWICLLNLVVSGRGSAFIAGVTIAPGTPNTSWSMRDAF
jgi:hypothetical protein